MGKICSTCLVQQSTCHVSYLDISVLELYRLDEDTGRQVAMEVFWIGIFVGVCLVNCGLVEKGRNGTDLEKDVGMIVKNIGLEERNAQVEVENDKDISNSNTDEQLPNARKGRRISHIIILRNRRRKRVQNRNKNRRKVYRG